MLMFYILKKEKSISKEVGGEPNKQYKQINLCFKWIIIHLNGAEEWEVGGGQAQATFFLYFYIKIHRKLQKLVGAVLYTLHCLSPSDYILHNCNSIAKRKLTVV